jgi:hypothetical protein
MTMWHAMTFTTDPENSTDVAPTPYTSYLTATSAPIATVDRDTIQSQLEDALKARRESLLNCRVESDISSEFDSFDDQWE